MKLKDAAPWKKNYDKPRQHIKKQKYHFTFSFTFLYLTFTFPHYTFLYSQSYGFSSNEV